MDYKQKVLEEFALKWDKSVRFLDDSAPFFDKRNWLSNFIKDALEGQEKFLKDDFDISRGIAESKLY